MMERHKSVNNDLVFLWQKNSSKDLIGIYL